MNFVKTIQKGKELLGNTIPESLKMKNKALMRFAFVAFFATVGIHNLQSQNGTPQESYDDVINYLIKNDADTAHRSEIIAILQNVNIEKESEGYTFSVFDGTTTTTTILENEKIPNTEILLAILQLFKGKINKASSSTSSVSYDNEVIQNISTKSNNNDVLKKNQQRNIDENEKIDDIVVESTDSISSDIVINKVSSSSVSTDKDKDFLENKFFYDPMFLILPKDVQELYLNGVDNFCDTMLAKIKDINPQYAKVLEKAMPDYTYFFIRSQNPINDNLEACVFPYQKTVIFKPDVIYFSSMDDIYSSHFTERYQKELLKTFANESWHIIQGINKAPRPNQGDTLYYKYEGKRYLMDCSAEDIFLQNTLLEEMISWYIGEYFAQQKPLPKITYQSSESIAKLYIEHIMNYNFPELIWEKREDMKLKLAFAYKVLLLDDLNYELKQWGMVR